MKKIIYDFSKCIYRWLCNHQIVWKKKRITKELSSLNPGKKIDEVVDDYYIGKIYKILLAGIVGTILVAATFVNEKQSGIISRNNTLERNKYGDGATKYELFLEGEDFEYGTIDVDVEEYLPTKDEMDKLISDFCTELEIIITDGNVSLDHVDTDLKLVNSIEGYPFFIRWELSNYELIDDNGKIIKEEIDNNGETVILHGVISYKEYESTVDYEALVFPKPLSEDELKYYRLRTELDKQNLSINRNDPMKLPEIIDGKQLLWHEKDEHLTEVIIIIFLCGVLGLWKGMDDDIRRQYDKRSQMLLEEYAEVVSTLEMYLSAGLTIRGAIERMDSDYKKHVREGGRIKNAYEELAICLKKLRDGNSEAKCLEEWGKRCELLCYRKITSLLIQNLKKGTTGLIIALENEMKIAFDERKAQVRRRGEEAQTKLLFPMIMMLGVVMIIIMIPAYFSFGM